MTLVIGNDELPNTGNVYRFEGYLYGASLLAHNLPLALPFLERRATGFLHRAGTLSAELRSEVPMNRPLPGYRASLAASIQGRTTSRFSEAHRLAPASGSSSSLITDSRSLICSSLNASASMNA